MATASHHYRDENARQNHLHGHHRRSSRLPVDDRGTGQRVRLVTQGEETIIQGTDNPMSPVRSLREEGNDMSYLDDIALLRRGMINKSSVKTPFTRYSPDGTAASKQIKPVDSPITLAELESRGLLINGQVVYTLPRGTKYSSKAREPQYAPADSSSTSRSWLTSASDSSSAAPSVAALVNDAKKPVVKTGDMQRLPDGTVVEKFALGKGGVRYLIETNDRVTTVEKRKGGSVIFSALKEQ